MKKLIVRINRHISEGLRNNIVVGSVLRQLYSAILPFDKDFHEETESAILTCLETDGGNRKELKSDILKEFVRTSVTPIEYASFGFFKKDIKDRNEYVPDHEIVSLCKWTKGHNLLPDGKDGRYRIFKNYFQRRVLCISPDEAVTESMYNEFMQGLDTVVCKPIRGTKGHGVEVVKCESIPTLESFRRQYQGDYLIEEAIQQGDELAKFHPTSVNTIRFVSGRDKQGIIRNVFSEMRCGRGGSLIDNTSSGGICAIIDTDKGIITSDAYEYGSTKRFKVHPDTGVPFCGYIIPEWKSLCLLAHDIHKEHSGQFIFGFDFAWTKKGWDLVEVNPAPSFDTYQQFTEKGVRPYLREIGML